MATAREPVAETRLSNTDSKLSDAIEKAKLSNDTNALYKLLLENARELESRGWTLVAINKYKEALKCAEEQRDREKIIAVLPNLVRCTFSCRKNSRFEDLRSDGNAYLQRLEKEVSRNGAPTSLSVLACRGEQSLLNAQLDDAFSNFSRAAELLDKHHEDPNTDFWIHSSLARTAAHKNDQVALKANLAKCESYYNKCDYKNLRQLAVTRTDAALFFARSKDTATAHRLFKSAEELFDAMEHRDNYYSALCLGEHARVMHDAGKQGLGEALAKRAIEQWSEQLYKRPNDAEVLFRRGAMYQLLAKNAEAAKDYDRSISLAGYADAIAAKATLSKN